MSRRKSVVVVWTVCLVLGLISMAGAVENQVPSVLCKAVPLAECMKSIGKVYNIPVDINIAPDQKTVDIAFQEASPLEAVKTVLESVTLSGYAVMYDVHKKRIIVSIMGPDALALPSTPPPFETKAPSEAAGPAGGTSGIPPKGLPSPEEMKKHASQTAPLNPDRVIPIPGQDPATGISERQIRVIQERAATGVRNEDEPLYPGATGENVITVRQAKQKVEEYEKTRKNNDSITLPDGSVLSVKMPKNKTETPGPMMPPPVAKQ